MRLWSKAVNKYIELAKPNTIDIYNMFMGDVDRADQMVYFYRDKLCGRKWYKNFVFHLINVCVTNGWVLSQNTNEDWPQLFNFKLNIALCLIKRAAIPNNMQGSDALCLVPDLLPSSSDPKQEKSVSNDVRLDGMHHYSRCLAKITEICKTNCESRTKYY